MMIEEGQRTVRRERGKPERQARQLDGHRVQIDAEQAPLGDCAPHLRASGFVEIGGAARSALDRRTLVGG
jgi:hypothetical protein